VVALFFASELGDLVESIHIIVGLMENLQGRGTLRVCNWLDMKLRLDDIQSLVTCVKCY